MTLPIGDRKISSRNTAAARWIRQRHIGYESTTARWIGQRHIGYESTTARWIGQRHISRFRSKTHPTELNMGDWDRKRCESKCYKIS
jgi:hypothetical protein